MPRSAPAALRKRRWPSADWSSELTVLARLGKAASQLLGGLERPWFPPLAQAVLAVLSAWLLWDHVLWRDEAHALLLAQRSTSLIDLLRILPYEQTPPLWHLGLWVLARLGVLAPESFLVLHWLSFQLLVASVLALPVPAWVRLAALLQLPTLHYMGELRQYTLIVALLLWLFGRLARGRRDPRPLALGSAALALLSTHGAILAAGFLLVWLGTISAEDGRQRLGWSLLPVTALIFAVVFVRHPPDLIAGLRGWVAVADPDLLATSARFFATVLLVQRYGLPLAAILLLAGLAIGLRQMSQNHRGRQAFALLLAAALVVGSFWAISLLKYSWARHRWLVTVFLLGLLVYAWADRWNRKISSPVALAALLLLGSSALSFGLAFADWRQTPRSRSREVARLLATRYPDRPVIGMLEHFVEPILAYRPEAGPFYSLGRQQPVWFTVWNHPTVDFASTREQKMELTLSEVLRLLEQVPAALLERHPVVVLSADRLVNDTPYGPVSLPIGQRYRLERGPHSADASYEEFALYAVEGPRTRVGPGTSSAEDAALAGRSANGQPASPALD